LLRKYQSREESVLPQRVDAVNFIRAETDR